MNSYNLECLERAVEEARHYILSGTDTFAVRVGNITIRKGDWERMKTRDYDSGREIRNEQNNKVQSLGQA